MPQGLQSSYGEYLHSGEELAHRRNVIFGIIFQLLKCEDGSIVAVTHPLNCTYFIYH